MFFVSTKFLICSGRGDDDDTNIGLWRMHRGNILEALLRETDNSVRDILAETLKLVALVDFPDDWPDLVPTIVAQLQTGEVLR